MNVFAIHWLELAVLVPLVGAAVVRFHRDAAAAWRWCVGIAAVALGCALMACGGHFTRQPPPGDLWAWAGQRVLAVDDFSAPLLPLVALLHLLTALCTARSEVGRFSFPALLFGAAVRAAAFACVAPWPLVALLVLDLTLPLLELRRTGRPIRLYLLHAAVCGGLLVAGCACRQAEATAALGAVLVLASTLVRTGVFPTHVWLTELFAVGPFGQFLVFVTPIAGLYPAVRLALPVAPEWALAGFAMVAVGSALYTAAMACVQTDARRFFAYFVVSHASLVLVGLGLDTPFAVTGALVMWLSAALSLAAVGLILRAVAARVGSLSLARFRGLYDHSPLLAVCFLLTGLASVGFPGTSGFVAIELLVDEAVGSHLIFGLLVVSTAALNGIAVVRVFMVLFTGCRHVTGVDLRASTRERVAVLTLVALILGGGSAPQAYLESRYQVTREFLRDRHPPADPHAVVP